MSARSAPWSRADGAPLPPLASTIGGGRHAISRPEGAREVAAAHARALAGGHEEIGVQVVGDEGLQVRAGRDAASWAESCTLNWDWPPGRGETSRPARHLQGEVAAPVFLHQLEGRSIPRSRRAEVDTLPSRTKMGSPLDARGRGSGAAKASQAAQWVVTHAAVEEPGRAEQERAGAHRA